MSRLSCPNCGAPHEPVRCSYCLSPALEMQRWEFLVDTSCPAGTLQAMHDSLAAAGAEDVAALSAVDEDVRFTALIRATISSYRAIVVPAGANARRVRP